MQQPCEKCGKITTWNQKTVEPARGSSSAVANQLGLASCSVCGSRGCFVPEPDELQQGAPLGIDGSRAEPDLVQLFTECLEAERKGHLRLAMMGYRGVLDLCFNRKFGRDIGTFVGKLEEAHNRGHLSQIELHHLEVQLTAGHTQAQGRFNPSPEVMPWIRYITYRLIKSVYENQDVNLVCQMIQDQN